MKPAAAALAVPALLFALGCTKQEPAPAEPQSAGPPPPALGRRPGGMDPSTIPGHPPMGANPHAGMPGMGGMEGTPPMKPPAGGVGKEHFTSPEGWQEEKPSMAMRLLQYRLPRADGDGEDGTVTVFTGEMGPVKANLDRWRGQFSEVVQGKDGLEEISEGVKGKVHLLDVSGKFGGGMGPVAGAHGAAEGSSSTRMIAAVVEHPSGSIYVKTWGPPATMGKWESSIRAFILDAAKK